MKMREIGGSSRVSPRPLRQRVARVAFTFAASLSLALSGVGCQTGGCGSCNLGNKLGNGVRATGASFRNLGSKVFHHKQGGMAYGTSAGCCGDSGVMSEGAVEYSGGGVPMSPGTIVPGPSGLGGEPSMLEPATPKAKTVAPGETTGATSGNSTNKSAFESASPRARTRGRSNNVALTPAPVSPVGGAQVVNPLDDLPPLEIPRPAPSVASAKPSTSDLLPPAAGEAPPLSVAPEIKPIESVSPPPAPPTTPAPPATANAAPGSAVLRLEVVEPGLAGGTVPNNEDMIRLVSLGYKTVIDLRNPDEVHSSFIACASAHGLRYVGLPVTPQTLDSTRITRFNLELSQTEARPIFFFDTSGSNAAALWSIRRQAIDKVDAQVARHEAEQIGTIDQARSEAIAKYLGSIKPVAVIEIPEPTVSMPVAGATIPAQDLGSETIPAVPNIPQSAAAWRPYAILALTGMGFPLAYWSRTSSFGSIHRVVSQASLPVRVRVLPALAHVSGE